MPDVDGETPASLLAYTTAKRAGHDRSASPPRSLRDSLTPRERPGLHSGWPIPMAKFVSMF